MRLRCLVLIAATFAAGCTSPSGWTLTEHIPTPSPVRVQLEQRESPDPTEAPYAQFNKVVSAIVGPIGTAASIDTLVN